MDFKSPIASIMTRQPLHVEVDVKLIEVQRIFDNHKIHHLPVVQKGKMVGMISRSDLQFFLKGLSNEAFEEILNEVRLQEFCAGDIMSKGIVSVSSAVTLSQAIGLFYRNEFHALPIIDNGQLVGILTTHDIIKALMEENVIPS